MKRVRPLAPVGPLVSSSPAGATLTKDHMLYRNTSDHARPLTLGGFRVIVASGAAVEVNEEDDHGRNAEFLRRWFVVVPDEPEEEVDE